MLLVTKLRKDFHQLQVQQKILTNHEIKYITKVIKSLENRGILLKETTKKISSKEGGFLSFLRSLMTTALPLMKMRFSTIRINSSSIGNGCSYSKENLWIRNNNINILK